MNNTKQSLHGACSSIVYAASCMEGARAEYDYCKLFYSSLTIVTQINLAPSCRMNDIRVEECHIIE